MNKDVIMKIIRIALILCIAATLVFIYAQSFKTPEQSTAESDKVGDIIAEIIPPETKPGAFIQTNIRKLAHFSEFFMLGIEIALYVLIFERTRIKVALLYPLGIILAVFDETVQIFTKRGPEIKDVWIDFLGYATGSLILTAVFFLAIVIIKKIKIRKQNG